MLFTFNIIKDIIRLDSTSTIDSNVSKVLDIILNDSFNTQYYINFESEEIFNRFIQFCLITIKNQADSNNTLMVCSVDADHSLLMPRCIKSFGEYRSVEYQFCYICPACGFIKIVETL
jgi:hypothetical protein